MWCAEVISRTSMSNEQREDSQIIYGPPRQGPPRTARLPLLAPPRPPGAASSSDHGVQAS